MTNSQTYIVTGGAGFIGSHLCDQLLSFGKSVVVIDNLSSGFIDNLPEHDRLKFLNIDIADWTALCSAYDSFQNVSGVFHLAAEARIQPSIGKPFLTNDTNVRGTLNILELMRMMKIDNIVYSSSSSCYGPGAEMPNKPDAKTNCQTPYSVSKLMGEQYCQTWGKLHGIKNITLRYFNVYGHRSPLSEQHTPVIGKFINQTLARNSMTIVGDGKQRRDFTHVKDIISANILAMKSLVDRSGKNTSGEIFNVGTGENFSIRQVADMINIATSTLLKEEEVGIVFTPERVGEAQETLADFSKTSSKLGYQPKIELEVGISNLIYPIIDLDLFY